MVRPLVLFSLCTLVASYGCASLGRPTFERPGVELQAIALQEVSASGATLDLLLAIDNPNVFTIDGAALEVTLDIEDVRFGEMTRAAPLRLPGRDTTLIWVPVSFTWAGVGAAARGVLTSGGVDYVVEGGIDLETPYGSGRVPYKRSGTLPILSSANDEPPQRSGR